MGMGGCNYYNFKLFIVGGYYDIFWGSVGSFGVFWGIMGTEGYQGP